MENILEKLRSISDKARTDEKIKENRKTVKNNLKIERAINKVVDKIFRVCEKNAKMGRYCCSIDIIFRYNLNDYFSCRDLGFNCIFMNWFCDILDINLYDVREKIKEQGFECELDTYTCGPVLFISWKK